MIQVCVRQLVGDRTDTSCHRATKAWSWGADEVAVRAGTAITVWSAVSNDGQHATERALRALTRSEQETIDE